jgi:phospholipid-translocating ATPase
VGITGFIATYIAPLAFVLFVTMGKEAYDDYKRYLRDKEANSAKYLVLEPSGVDTTSVLDGGPHTRSVPSSSICVGDLILLEKNQRVPADLVLLRTSDSSGTCFIRTDQLDGETDWKLRAAVPACQKLHSDRDLLSLDAEIYGTNPMLPFPVADIKFCTRSRPTNKRHPHLRWDFYHQFFPLPVNKRCSNGACANGRTPDRRKYVVGKHCPCGRLGYRLRGLYWGGNTSGDEY